MDNKNSSPQQLRRLICDCADELRDYWLCHQSEQAIREIMALSLSQQRMMRKVWRMNLINPDGVMLKELAEKLSLSSSAVSVMVDAMVRRGILIREAAQDDRRKVMIRVSEKGKEFGRTYDAFFLPICSEFAESQTPEDMAVFMKVLEKLNLFLCKQLKED